MHYWVHVRHDTNSRGRGVRNPPPSKSIFVTVHKAVAGTPITERFRTKTQPKRHSQSISGSMDSWFVDPSGDPSGSYSDKLTKYTSLEATQCTKWNYNKRYFTCNKKMDKVQTSDGPALFWSDWRFYQQHVMKIYHLRNYCVRKTEDNFNRTLLQDNQEVNDRCSGKIRVLCWTFPSHFGKLLAMMEISGTISHCAIFLSLAHSKKRWRGDKIHRKKNLQHTEPCPSWTCKRVHQFTVISWVAEDLTSRRCIWAKHVWW